MKQLLLVFTLAFLTGCSELDKFQDSIDRLKSTPDTVSAPVTVTKPQADLAWSKEPKGSEWTYLLDESMHSYPEDLGGIKVPCKKISPKQCAKQLLSIIAKRESNFKPETSFNETGHLQGVVSRGLFQISKDSANQSAYKCNIVDAKDLHNPHINIQCAVKILSKWVLKDRTLIDQPKLGCARYWSVCRSKDGKSESYKYIMKYMSGF